MKGLLPTKLLLLFGAVAHAQDFFPIDSFEMSPDKSVLDSEDYFSRDHTSRHSDDYPSEYDSDEDYDSRSFSSLDYDPRENEALYDSPSRPSSDKKQKRQEYFDGLSKKVHETSRKNLDLVAGASDHFPRQRSERNRRARLSDYDNYYPKRKVNNENLRSSPKTQPESFDFDDFFHTTMNPVFDSERPSSTGFNDQRESRNQNPYDEPRQHSPEFKTDSSYRKSSHPVKPRKLLPGFDDDSYSNSKPFRSVEPRRPSTFDDSHSYSKPAHSVEPRRPSTGFNDDFHSYRKPSHSVEPRRPSTEFNDDFHSYSKPSHSVEPKRPVSVYDFHDDSFSKPSHSIHDGPRNAPMDLTDFEAKPYFDEPKKPSSAFSYQTESYPKQTPTESYHRKPAKKIRQRSKKIDVKPYHLKPIEPESLSQFFSVPKTKDSQTYRSKPAEPESLSQFFSVPKTKDSSSRAARPTRVKSSPRKLSEVHGRSAVFDDDFSSKPASFKKERRRPGLFTEEKEHFLSATGYGKPVREQFHEQGTTGPHSYKFGYNTGDIDNPMARYEERSPDGLVKGSYSYVDPLGKLQVVHYESHPERGFKTTH